MLVPQTLITSLFQDVLRQSSLDLNARLAGSAYFQAFVLVVPSSWDPAHCGFNEEPLTPATPYTRADLVIGADHPVHGSAPFVEHSSGCGAEADMIYLPLTFLTKMDNITKNSNEIVRKWIEYRYGVFSDESYPGDRLYPNVFMNNITDSYHSMPTKQLVVCEGRTRDQVLSSHPDFIGIRTDNEPMRAIEPEIRIVKEPRVKYVLAVETTASMEEGEDWKWVNKAAQKLIRYDLPTGSNLAVLTFNNITRVEHPMVQITDDDTRAKLADTIPGKYHLSSSNIRCVACVLQAMVRGVLQGDSVGAHLILVTRAGTDSLSLTDEKIITEYVKNYGIKISTIMIPTVNHLPFYDDISQISGGKSFLVKRSAFAMDTYVSILDSIQAILSQDPEYNSAINIHKNEHYTEGDGNITTGSFSVDSSLSDTVLGIYVEDTEDHLIKSVTLSDEEGTVYGPYSKMSTTFDLINFKTVNVVGESPLSNPKISVWKYKIVWFNQHGDTRKSIVRVTSRSEPSGENALTLNSWVKRRQAFNGYNPVEVFAKLSRGNSPVVAASVYATIEVENENGSLITLSRLILRDDGLGDSDLQTGDGLYSAVLVHHGGPGRYSFTVHADDNKAQAFSIQPIMGRAPLDCCGSFLDVPQSRRVLMDSFSRTIQGSVVHLSSLPAQDIAPPSKIGDLIIELSSDNKTIQASWTSPGGDFASGSVVRYRFLYSTNITDLLKASSSPPILIEIEKPTKFGSAVLQLLEFPLYNQDYFIGLYAYDLAGNRGRMSNIQHVYVPSPPPPPTPLPIPRLGLPPSTSTDWMMIIAISCGMGALLIVCILSIIYYLITSRRERPESPSPSSTITKEEIPSSDHTDSSSCHSDRQGSHNLDEKDCQVTDLHQIIGEQSRITPVYWSASQLLSKLDSPDRNLGKESFHSQAYTYYGASVNRSYSDESSRTGVVNRTFDHEPARILDNEEHQVRTPRHEHRASRFERNNFYRSSRMNRTFDEDSYQGFGTPLPPARTETARHADIPDEFCVTVSSISNSDTDSLSDKFRPSHILSKPRNITEV